MKKKAQFLFGMQMITFLFMVFFFALSIMILLITMNQEKVDQDIVQETLQEEYNNQLLYSPSCFAYEDPLSQRVDRGLLDEKKITSITLEACQTFGVKPPYTLRPTAIFIDYKNVALKDIQINTTLWYGPNAGTKRNIEVVYILVNGNKEPATITIAKNPYRKQEMIA